MESQTEEDLIKCYGTRLECPNRKECSIGEPCLSRAKESSEDLHYQYQHVSVPQMIYDPNDDRDNNGDETSRAYFEAATEDSVQETLSLDGITVTPEALPVVLSVLERVAEFYFNTPHVLDALLNMVVKGKSQSDLAREKHITRQCENKRLLRELGIAQKRNDVQERRDRELESAKREYSDRIDEFRNKNEFLKNLSTQDWVIYKSRFLEKLSAFETAKRAQCNIRTVFRKSQYFRRKLGENGIVFKMGRRKKHKKTQKNRSGMGR